MKPVTRSRVLKGGLLKRRPDHPEASLHCTCLVHISLSIQGTTVVLVKRYALLLLLTTFFQAMYTSHKRLCRYYYTYNSTHQVQERALPIYILIYRPLPLPACSVSLDWIPNIPTCHTLRCHYYCSTDSLEPIILIILIVLIVLEWSVGRGSRG